MKRNDVLKLVLSCMLPLSAAAIGSLSTTAQSDWYRGLIKPFFNPPGWVFGPVWTVLYLMMGISFFLIWRRGFSGRAGRAALVLFLSQLTLNAIWTLLFFGLQSPLLALADIVLLWILIVFTIHTFATLSKPAAWLLIPYMVWVSFASVLNAAIWWLNQ